MRRTPRRRAAQIALGAIAAVAMAVPAAAGADTTTLSNTDGIDLAAGDPAFHPGDPYPSTIPGPAGTVNDVNVTLSESHANPDDLDIQLVSPNGTAVFLHSDACGADGAFRPLSFDDASAIFLSDLGPCPSAGNPYRPSNYNPMAEVDIYTAPASPTPVNNLAAFNGGPSGGTWSLFTMDDTNGSGGSISGWTIALDFTPPPPVTPVNPAPTPTTTPTITPPAQPKCKKKKKKRSASAAAKCKKKKKK